MRSYDTEFATQNARLTDTDMAFGRRHGLVKESNQGNLAHLFPIENLPYEWSESHEKWRLVSLIWAIENLSGNDRDLFDEIDTIWSNFNEPKDMNGIVSFMPSEDVNSSYHTLRESIDRFIESKRKIFGFP